MKYVMGYLSVSVMVALMSSTVFPQQEETLGDLYFTGVEEIDKKTKEVGEGHCKLRKIWHNIVQTDKTGDKENTLKGVRKYLKEGKFQEKSIRSARKILMTPGRVAKHLDIINFLNAAESSLQKDMQQMNMLLGVLLIYMRIPRTINVTALLSGEKAKNKVFITTSTDKDNLFPGGVFLLSTREGGATV